MSMQTNTKQSLARRWESYQPSKSALVWACAATAVATMIVGFSWGGWVTGGTSLVQAKAAGDAARGELAAVICIDKFKAAPDTAAQLVLLNAITDSYKRRQFVEAGGWATMPGQTSPDRRAAEGCAAALAA
jgi:alpha/beta superfamily hydrolase